jgi:cell division septal protein FtsQ
LNRSREAQIRRRSRRILGRTLLAFFACGVLLIAGCGAYRKVKDWSVFSIRRVAVRGVPSQLASSVVEASAIKTGTSMFELDRELISRRVRSLDFVKEVRIRRRPSGRVILDVLKREPFALINGSVIVGEDGVEVKAHGETPDIPELTCPLEDDGRGRKSVDSDLLSQAVFVLGMARELEVKRIDISHPEDLLVVLENGASVHLGRGDFREKLSMVSVVIADRKESRKKFNHVDARFNRQVLVSK